MCCVGQSGVTVDERVICACSDAVAKEVAWIYTTAGAAKRSTMQIWCSVLNVDVDKKAMCLCRRWAGHGGRPNVQRGGCRPAAGRSTRQTVQRLERHHWYEGDVLMQRMGWPRRSPGCTARRPPARRRAQHRAGGAASAALRRPTSACAAGRASARASATRCTPRRAASSLWAERSALLAAMGRQKPHY